MYGLLPPLPARRHGEDAEPAGLVDRVREVVVEGDAVGAAERQVHDVDVVTGGAVAVGVDGEVHALDEGDPAAGRRLGGADLHGVQGDTRGHALGAADDVADVRAVALVVDGIGIGRQRRRGRAADPGLADEVVAADHPGRREEAVLRGVPRVGRARAVGRLVGGKRPGAAEGDVGVVDAAVENGDADALAVVPGSLDGGAAHVRDGLLQGHLVVDDRLDLDDRRVGGELDEGLRVDAEHHDVGGPAGAAQDPRGAVEPPGGRNDLVLLRARLLVLRLLRGRALGGHVDGGSLGQADDHLLGSPGGPQGRVDLVAGGHGGRARGLELELLDPLRERSIRPLRRVRGERRRGDRHGERGADEGGDESPPTTGHDYPSSWVWKRAHAIRICLLSGNRVSVRTVLLHVRPGQPVCVTSDAAGWRRWCANAPAVSGAPPAPHAGSLSTSSRTDAADWASSAFSPSVSEISITRSMPPLPRTTGTPTKRPSMPYSPWR